MEKIPLKLCSSKFLLDEYAPSKENRDSSNMDKRAATIFHSLKVVCLEFKCQEALLPCSR